MPIIKSAKKALRQNAKRRIANKARKQKIKTILKETRVLAGAKKIEDAKKNLPAIFKALDKAAKTGTIKPNTAARKKSRIAKLLAKTSA
ncbi:MAG: 30S ribosomal protein S20 [Candidatus Nealsonbacteria bacterium DGGOD1a]|jgi:ribosomal protein S20|nr:MAG: 30S ribosomal protein S20 [Candidatus Nealsonbacteria bacterium DGGOD1a]